MKILLLKCYALLILASLASSTFGIPSSDQGLSLPNWEILEFEKKAFWATAHSKMRLDATPDQPEKWQLSVESSIPKNSESITIDLDATTGNTLQRKRFSKGIDDSRYKSYIYMDKSIIRERRDSASSGEPSSWPLSSQLSVQYPPSAPDTIITDSYSLLIIAGELMRQGAGATRDVLVHTDLNFYRARMTCNTGIPVKADYKVKGGNTVKGVRETIGVVIRVRPEAKLQEKDDFMFLGLSGDIIILFDDATNLPLQIRGLAPRIGETNINLKSVTMRPPLE